MKILVIPDIHEHIDWAQKALDGYSSNCDRVVFLGDYFDYWYHIFPVKDICQWLDVTKKTLGDKAVWLVGNHDIHYMQQTYCKKRDFAVKFQSLPFGCSGYSRSKADKIKKYWKDHTSFFDGLQLCHKQDDWVFSHAGFVPQHFQPYKSVDDNIQSWNDDFENFKKDLKIGVFQSNSIWRPGTARGGKSIVGSPIWLDWNWEFSVIDGIRQIVGHTQDKFCRQIGDNYNIDTGQNHFAVVDTITNEIDIHEVDQ